MSERKYEEIAHDYEPCDPSNSGREQVRCKTCEHVTAAPVYAKFYPCVPKLDALLDRVEELEGAIEDALEEWEPDAVKDRIREALDA